MTREVAKNFEILSQKMKPVEYDDVEYDVDFCQPPSIKPDFPVTLVSRDGVRFRIAANVLRTASPVFDTMLSLPQPEGAQEATIDSLDEDASVIKGILQIIGGRVYPDSCSNFSSLQALALAADKWDMQGLLSLFRMFFLNPDLVRNHAIGVYWAGCRFQWPDVVKIASSHSCPQDLFCEKSQPLLRMLSSDHLLRLMNFHRKKRHDAMLSWLERKGQVRWISNLNSSESLNQTSMYEHFKYGVLKQMEQLAPTTRPSQSDIALLVSKTRLGEMLERGRQLDAKGLISELLTQWDELPTAV